MHPDPSKGSISLDADFSKTSFTALDLNGFVVTEDVSGTPGQFRTETFALGENSGSTIARSGEILDDFTTSGEASLEVGLRYTNSNLPSRIEERFASAFGGFSVTYNFTPSDDYDPAPFVLDPDPVVPFDQRLVFSPADVIGAVDDVSGDPEIVRADGTREPLTNGKPIGVGDTIVTDPNDTAIVRIADGSEVEIPADAEIPIDEFFRPENQDDEDTRILKSLFVFTNGIIGREDQTNGDRKIDCCGVGIRGDAAEIIQRNDPDLFNEVFDPAVKGNVGSPVTIFAPIDISPDPFTLAFDFAFLSESGVLDVFLGDSLIFSEASSTGSISIFNTANVFVDDPDLLSLGWDTLKFRFDGPTGASFILDDVLAPGLRNGDFSSFDSGWFVEGPGTADLVLFVDEDALEAALAPVPVPASFQLLLVSLLGSFAFMRKRVAR